MIIVRKTRIDVKGNGYRKAAEKGRWRSADWLARPRTAELANHQIRDLFRPDTPEAL